MKQEEKCDQTTFTFCLDLLFLFVGDFIKHFYFLDQFVNAPLTCTPEHATCQIVNIAT